MTGSVEIANLNMTISSLVTVALTIVILIAMGYLVDYTTLGLQLRAASSDFKTARLLGVRSNRLITSSFAISGVLAAFVGFIIVVENPQVEPMFGLNITILALVGIVIGGISSLRGCALGGFIVGFILSEVVLFLQGTMFWGAMGFMPYYYELLFGVSALLPIGLFFILGAVMYFSRKIDWGK